MDDSVSFLFDLDGTLVDSVYQNVSAWKEAFDSQKLEIPFWKIHRRIGMSGDLMLGPFMQESGIDLDDQTMDAITKVQSKTYERLSSGIKPLPGAVALLQRLHSQSIPWAIATSGSKSTAEINLLCLKAQLKKTVNVPVITREEAARGKPHPDLYIAAAKKLDVVVEHSIIVGDSLWDMLAARRCKALGIGLLSGGYGKQELQDAGAFRVYDDATDLLKHLHEIA